MRFPYQWPLWLDIAIEVVWCGIRIVRILLGRVS